MGSVAEDMIAHRLVQAARLLNALVEQRAEASSAAERRALQKQRARRQQAREAKIRMEEYIDRVVAEMPPLSAEQRVVLARLLAPTPEVEAKWQAEQDRIAKERRQNRVTVRTAIGLQ